MENEKDYLLRVFNNVISEIETTNGRVLSMYDVIKLTEHGIPVLEICIKNIPFACFKRWF